MRASRFRCAAAAAGVLVFTALGGPAAAADYPSPVPTANPQDAPLTARAPAQPHQSILVFGGQYTTDGLVRSLLPFTANHENNYIVGGAYERDFAAFDHGWVLGAEVGIADRFGMGQSGELWAGINIRNRGAIWFNAVRISPGVTVGFSAITNPVGIEAQRQTEHGGNAHFLAYLGPELAFAFQQMPNLELVYRLQHRSGAGGTFSHMREGANANVFGLRYRFDNL